MKTKSAIHEIIPEEVINFFLDGRYAGQLGRTKRYNHIAWSLFLRGVYSYVVMMKDENEYPHHAGICSIDFQSDLLRVGGIRLFECKYEDLTSPSLEDLVYTCRFWNSDLEALKPNNRSAELDFVYTLGGDFAGEKSYPPPKELEPLIDTTKKLDVKVLHEMCTKPNTTHRRAVKALEKGYEYLRDYFWNTVNVSQAKTAESYALVKLRRELDSDSKDIIGDYRPITAGPPPGSADDDAALRHEIPFSSGTRIRLVRIQTNRFTG